MPQENNIMSYQVSYTISFVEVKTEQESSQPTIHEQKKMLTPQTLPQIHKQISEEIWTNAACWITATIDSEKYLFVVIDRYRGKPMLNIPCGKKNDYDLTSYGTALREFCEKTYNKKTKTACQIPIKQYYTNKSTVIQHKNSSESATIVHRFNITDIIQSDFIEIKNNQTNGYGFVKINDLETIVNGQEETIQTNIGKFPLRGPLVNTIKVMSTANLL